MWDADAEELFNTIQSSEDYDTITAVSKELQYKLDDRRQSQWVEMVESLDFTHSSRKAWSLMKILSGESKETNICPAGANKLAKQLYRNSQCYNPEKIFTRHVKHAVTAEKQRPTAI